MAITTIDELIAGMLPPENFLKIGGTHEAIARHHSRFYEAGLPGAGAAPSNGVNGGALTSYAGQIPFPSAVGGKNIHLARLQAAASATGCLLLCDRLWHNSGLSITSIDLQELASVAWPARDRDGSINGVGVLVALEHSVLSGAGTPTLTLGYTNSAGVNGRTGTVAGLTTSQPGTFYIFALNGGDIGVRSIQSYQQSATWTSGTIHLVAFRILAILELPGLNIGASIDAISGGFVRLYDNTVPFLVWIPTATTAVALTTGQVIYTQG